MANLVCLFCGGELPPKQPGAPRFRHDECRISNNYLAAFERSLTAAHFPDSEEGRMAVSNLRHRLMGIINSLPSWKYQERDKEGKWRKMS